jgi:hypothetical protein
VDKLRSQGMSEAEIARGFGITTTQLRAAKSIAVSQQRQEKIQTAERLKDKGWSNVAIAERMGINESSVRSLLAPGAKDKADALQTTANMLRDHVTEKKYIDVGRGVENQLGITHTRLNAAVAVLREKGYQVFNVYVPQLNMPGKRTTVKVLAPPGTKLADVNANRHLIQQINSYSDDGGRSFLTPQAPISVSSRRIGVVYAEDGGAKADGVIYVRKGVKDLSIGSDRYAQVRIAVDGTHYLKGMAVYKDDMPDGVDLLVNTNKSSTGRKKDVMKEISDDPDLPFGSIVRQIHGPDGKVSSAMNIVGGKEGAGAEGSWDTWSRTLSSQMLAKQDPRLITSQLRLTQERRQEEFDKIMALTNPTVRKEFLLKFADQTDAAAVHLQAAAMPRQATRVLLPIPSMKSTEVYAPTFRDGETVALVRYPHGGTFEIPQLKVNNRNREAKRIIGPVAKDAIGINHQVARHLSGADFDGDTVIVIPNKSGRIKSTPALDSLKNFDPQVYKLPKDSPIPRINPVRKQQEMGKVSNLITDMTIHGAKADEIARAVRHSMVVIDSEKHGLDFLQSEKDHGILALKEKYQGGKRAGASTLLSKAGAEIRVPERVPRPARRGGPIDPVTGRKVFESTGRQVPEVKVRRDPVTGERVRIKTGAMKPRTVTSVRLAEVDDAALLSSGSLKEGFYVEHSNRLKAMANNARKEALQTKTIPYSPSARRVYQKEVATINAKLNLAEKNAPLERQANLIANTRVSQRRRANPHMLPEDEKKIRQQELTRARITTGAHKTKIVLTQKEWDAIQAGAISGSKLDRILKNSDTNTVRKLAMPKRQPKMTSAKLARAERMLAAGYTQAEVADALGVGLTTLKEGING